jgi:hypothetical protein
MASNICKPCCQVLALQGKINGKSYSYTLKWEEQIDTTVMAKSRSK